LFPTLSNTDEDPSKGFVSPEEMENAGFWLAVAWVGAGLDLAASVKVIHMLKAGKTQKSANDDEFGGSCNH